MKHEIFWPQLKQAFGNQKVFWTGEELSEKPGTTDRVIHYVISYFESPAVARNALRIFRGITQELGCSIFSGWNEVRVSSLREIDDAIRQAGAKGDTWELALTIKDFLYNIWQTLDTVDLTEAPTDSPQLIGPFLDQLRGISGSWMIDSKDKDNKKICPPAPLRYSQNNFYKHFKKYRQMSSPVLPSCAVDFLEYCWKRTGRAPFENHANRILARLGIFDGDEPISAKLIKFEAFTTSKKPVTKHKHLIQLGKIVCFAKNPRCAACPVADQCAKNGVN
jgi:hypothetical protein